MTRGVRLYLVGSFVLVSLAGCGRGFFQSDEREPWRAEAEIACLKSGAVKESPELVRIDPISGPGVCGAEFPLKVAALGESSGSFGFADDDLRPPGNIGNQPRWPISQPPPLALSRRICLLFRRCLSPASCAHGSPATAPSARLRSDLAGPRAGRCRAPDEDEIDLPPEGTPGSSSRRLHTGSYQGSHSPIRATAPRGALFAASRRAGRYPQAAPLPRLGPARGNPGRGVRAGCRQTRGDAGLSDRLGARSLARRFRAAGRAALVRRARRRDQADLRLFLPRHERQFARAYFRTCLRQCAGYRRLHARRRPAHLGEGRLEGACRKSRVFCTTCRPPPASNSPPCWRRAPTSITTITSTSI